MTCGPRSPPAQRAFGENYAQELRDKRAALAADPQPPEWHYIGPLQSNKIKYVAGQVALAHTVDSAALVEAIEARGVPQACLVQVNVAGEAQKRGIAPGDLPALLDRFATMSHVTCAGLMVIRPSPTTLPTRAPTSRRSARCAIGRRPARGRTSSSASCRWG